MISKLKNLLSIGHSPEDVADSNFKRKLAFIILVNNNKYIVGLGIILTLVFVFSGSGDGLYIPIIDVHLKPISETAVALLSSTSGYLLKSWQDEKQLILSYYYFNKNNEELTSETEETTTKHDLHKNPIK